MLQDQTAVKEYITKYNLEDELSNAVNLAIKKNSEDPYLVISDYMKSLSTTEPEDDEDDEDDVIQEDQMPVMKARGRRDQVMQPKFEIPSDWKAPVYEKDADDTTFLKETMETNKLMRNLAPSDRQALQLAFYIKEFKTGEVIIKQGDPGDLFYIVKSGECDISVESVGSVMKASRGVAFGELALLHNAPRAATVTAESDVVTFALDMLSFKAILMGKSQQDQSDYVSFLNTVELLQPLCDADKQTMASALQERQYPAGKNIICEGDEGNEFYLIRSGEVKCTKIGSSEEVSRRLKRGDFFGELALISSDKRAATVTTVTDTTVLALSRTVFERVLGKLNDIIRDAGAQARS